jgi:hypothetical protein
MPPCTLATSYIDLPEIFKAENGLEAQLAMNLIKSRTGNCFPEFLR